MDGLRVPITEWLYAALATNVAYDHFVAELVNPQSKGTAGFVNGIRWRGDLNASQKPHMQAAQGVAQVFLGVNLKCASCHDSLINDWSLSDAYGMAAVYAEEPRLEMHECDRPTGRRVAARFLFPELGDIPGDATDNERIRRLAEIITSRANGRLTRTVVNRLWQRLMGRGLVDPVDEMEQGAWHPDLLDWLAEDFAAHGQDLKRTLGLILTSRAYQMPSVSLGDRQKAPFIFTGPAVRRLTAEQFRDALGSLTGVWYESAARPIDFTAGLAPGVRADLLRKGPRWIWSVPDADAGAEEGTVCFYKMFYLPTAPAEALVAVTADSRFVLYVNGVRAASGKQWSKVQVADIRAHLRAGENVITVEAVNASDSNTVSHGAWKPAGLVLYARLRDRGRLMDVATDSSWRWAANRTLVMNAEGAKPKGLKPSVELGDTTMHPWSIEPALVAGLSQALVRGGVRSALVAADPLATALGRPPREQVVSVRASEGTTLQALELTNGRTLTDVIRRGAERLLAGAGSSQREFVASLYLKALGRAPTEGEFRLAGELLSQPMKAEQVEDFVWSMTMLPEFQLIY